MQQGLIRDLIWVNDPGLLRLRQAARTVIAVVIALAVFYRLGSLIALFGAFSAASFMQANSGTHRRQRQTVMIVTGVATALLVFAGAMCHGHRVAMELLLLAAGFACFYARRFVPDRNLFTLYSFVLCVLAATFSGPWPHPLWIALAVLSALPIAFAVYFYIWPPVFHLRFAAGVRVFGELAARCIDGINSALADGRQGPEMTKRIARVRSAMEANSSLTGPLKGSSAGKAADTIVRLMRRVVVCFELLDENVRSIDERQRIDLSDAIARTAAALRQVRAEFLAPELHPVQNLHADALRQAVIDTFDKAPEHRRDERAAALLVEAGILAVRLEELRSRMGSALRDPAFLEER